MHDIYAERQKHLKSEIQSYISENGIASVLNDTKWTELCMAMRSLKNRPRYRQKWLIDVEDTTWDREWNYHLLPYSAIEWIDIDPIWFWDQERKSEIEIDKTQELTSILRGLNVPFSFENGLIRVWGYVRPGTSPKFDA